MPRKPAALIGLLAAVYIAARLWRLTDSCLWFDEIFGIHAAEHTWAGLIEFVAKDLIHPPLFYALLKLWIAVGGEGLLWLRLFPVLFAVLALLPLWMLCRELKLRPAAVTVAFGLFAVNGALIKYAQEVRMYSLLLFLSLVSIWLFSRFFFRGKSFWMLVLVNVLLVYSHYFGWFVVASEVVAIAIAQRIKVLQTLLMLGIVAAAFVPWVLAIFRFAEPGSSVKQNIGWMQRPGPRHVIDLALDLVEPFYFQQSSVDSFSNLIIGLPMFGLIAAAAALYLLRLRREENRDRILFLTVFAAVPILAAFGLSWILPISIWGSRHLLIVFAPAIVVAGIVMADAAPRWIGRGLIATAFLLSVIALVIQIRTPQVPQIWCSWERLAEEVPTDRSQTVYALEDLSAYHLWFATRTRADVRIVKVDEMPGVTEDKAYFLPRGFDGVGRTVPADIDGDRFWLAFRYPRWDERHPPISYLLGAGYRIGRKFEVKGTGETGFLVEVAK